jgi:hypothetical protein
VCPRATTEAAESSITEWAAQQHPIPKGLVDVFPRAAKLGFAGATASTAGAVAIVGTQAHGAIALLIAGVGVAAVGAMSYTSRFRDLWLWTLIARDQLVQHRELTDEHLAVARARFPRETGELLADIAARLELPPPTVCAQLRRCADSAAIVATLLVLVWTALVIDVAAGASAIAGFLPPRLEPIVLAAWGVGLGAGVAFTWRFAVAVADDLAAYAHRQISVADELGELVDDLADVNQNPWWLTVTG